MRKLGGFVLGDDRARGETVPLALTEVPVEVTRKVPGAVPAEEPSIIVAIGLAVSHTLSVLGAVLATCIWTLYFSVDAPSAGHRYR